MKNDSKIKAKLFLGFLLKPDLKDQLEKNGEWRNQKLDSQNLKMIELFEKKQTYLGRFIDQETVSLRTLQQTEKELQQILLKFLPECSLNELHFEIFSKIFVL